MKNFSFIIEKLKLNKKNTLLRHVSLLIATLMLLSVAVWAWFSMQTNANANGLNVTLGAGKNLDMSLDLGKTYHGTFDLLGEDDQQYISTNNQIKDKLNMFDVTSDGKVFWNPKFKEQTDGLRQPDVNSQEQWTHPNPNYAYISETITFRTTFPADIYMGKNTAITTSTNKLVGADAENKSDRGDFSRDCIVGALRISAIDSNNQLKFVMIPRSEIKLVEASDGSFTANTNNTSNIHTYYPESYQSGTTTKQALTAFTAVDGGKAPNDNTKIATTTASSDGYYYGTATVNIWLEGCDEETRRVLSGGKFNISLDFVAFEITE